MGFWAKLVRDEREGKEKKNEGRYMRLTWMLRKYLIIILILFDYFNYLNCDID